MNSRARVESAGSNGSSGVGHGQAVKATEMSLMKGGQPKRGGKGSDRSGRLSFFEEQQSEARAKESNGTPGKFPGTPRCYGVMNPYSDWRILWDSGMLFFVLYVMFVTPFELAFVQHSSKMSDFEHVLANRQHLGLAVADTIVDVFFFVDILLQCNTALHIEEVDTWVLDRPTLLKRYSASGWLYIDVASLLPYDELHPDERLSMLRLLKLFRLFKLLKVLRAPRIIAKWSKVFSVSFKTGLIIKYSLVLVVILHLSACVIRIAHDLQTNGGEKHDVSTFLNTSGPDLHRGKFHKGNFNVYMDCLDWGLQTLSGSSMYISSCEAVLCVLMNLIGLLFFSFLVADLTNILCNLDPAKNEFKQTVDCLNDFMKEAEFPVATRFKLREYLVHSEVLFQVKFHNELISRLSPPLQAQVCSMLLGKRIVGIPFFSYAKACELELRCGKVVHVKPRRAPGEPRPTEDPRAAKIVRMSPGLIFDVRYLDDGAEEPDVAMARLAMDMEPAAVQLRVSTIDYESSQMIKGIARRLDTCLYLARDFIVERSRTLNDQLYLLDEGSVMTYGLENPLAPLKLTRLAAGDYIGDDIAMIINATDQKMNDYTYRRYSARCARTTQLYCLDAQDFHSVIVGPRFPIFRMYVARYGVWMRLRMTIINHVRRIKKHHARERSRSRLLDADVGYPRPEPRGRGIASWAKSDPFDDVRPPSIHEDPPSHRDRTRRALGDFAPTGGDLDDSPETTPRTTSAFKFFGLSRSPRTPKIADGKAAEARDSPDSEGDDSEDDYHDPPQTEASLADLRTDLAP